MYAKRKELQQINCTARYLLELIEKKEEYLTLTAELRLIVEMNEVEIFELMKYGDYETSILLSAR